MLYLIGGTSRSGKSLLAKSMLAKAGLAYFPLDAAVMGFTQGFPRVGIHDKLFPDVIARRMWPFTRALCQSLIYAGDDYVVEGEAFLPEQARALLDQFPGQVACCFLGYADITPARKVRQLKAHPQGAGDWLLQENDRFILSHVKHMVAYSRRIRRDCKKQRLKYFDVSQRFTPTLAQAFRFLSRFSDGV